MPFIDTKTTKIITKEQEKELTRAFGEAITLIRGKSEEWLMLNFTDNCRMAFRSDSETDSAILEVKIFGKATDGEYSALTSKLCEIMSSVLGIRKDRIYVKYEEIDVWGYNGFNF